MAANLLVAFGFVAVVVLCGVLYRYNKRRAVRLIEKWAGENGVRILETRFRYLARGPFMLGTRDGDQIYQITAERSDGLIATGWLRCSMAVTGRGAGRVDVKWDEVRGFPVIMRHQDEN